MKVEFGINFLLTTSYHNNNDLEITKLMINKDKESR